METSDLIIGILIALLIFCFFGHLLVIHTINIDDSNANNHIKTTKVEKIYIPVPVPSPHPYIGGCSGTQYGCCVDGITAKHDAVGTNCSSYPPVPVPPSYVGGCSGTQFGCCPNGVTAKIDANGSNCMLKLTGI